MDQSWLADTPGKKAGNRASAANGRPDPGGDPTLSSEQPPNFVGQLLAIFAPAIAVARRHPLLVAVGLLLGMVVAAAAAARVVPKVHARAVVQFTPAPENEGSSRPTASFLFPAETTAEIEVLQDPELILKAFERARYNIQAIPVDNGGPLVTMGETHDDVHLEFGYVRALFSHARAETDATVEVLAGWGEDIALRVDKRIVSLRPGETFTAEGLELTRAEDVRVAAAGTSFRILSSNTLRSSHAPKLKVAKIEESESGSLIELDFESPEEELAVQVLDSLLEVYLEQAEAMDKFDPDDVIGADDLEAARRELSAAEDSLRHLMVSKGVIDPDTEARVALEGIADMERKALTTEMEVDAVREARASPDGAGHMPASFPPDPVLRSSLQDLTRAEADMDSQASRLKEGHADLTAEGGALSRRKARMQKQLKAAEVSVRGRLSSLKGRAARLAEQLELLPELKAKLRERERRVVFAEQVYLTLLRLSQERLSAVELTNRRRVLRDPYVLSKSHLALSARVFAGGTLVSLLLSLLFARCIELVPRPKIKGVESLANLQDASVIAHLIVDPNRPAPAEHDADLRNARAHEEIATACLLNGKPDRGALIGITSTARGDGRSVLACHLATTLARTGNRVLLADFDAGNPGLHFVWSRDPARGIVQFLLQGMSPRKLAGLVHEVSLGDATFDVLLGSQRPYAAPGLLNARVRRGIASMLRTYDIVILDLAPYDHAVTRVILESCDFRWLVANQARNKAKEVRVAASAVASLGKFGVVLVEMECGTANGAGPPRKPGGSERQASLSFVDFDNDEDERQSA
ncbi:MAG: hypothetical protein V3V08_00190 [Nannocystaceae bacterium]